MTTMYQAANALAGAALSIIPADPHTKKPLVDSWKGFQQTAATTDQIREWFTENGHAPAGALAIVCGAVSQGITVIDFDTLADASTLYDEWAALVEEAVPGLVARLVLVGTPSGGRHIYFRCSVCEGNTKLAESHKRETWIETRGEGGYVLAPLSPGYKTLQGSLITIPTLEPAERSLLLTAAKVLTKYVPTRGPHTDTDSLPGAALNAKTSLDDIERWLTGAGWQRVGSKHDGTRLLRRPGKSDAGWSATLGRGGTRNFYVFSSNAAPFEMDTDYHAFAVYTMLYHNGEYSAAARQLAADGLGGNRQQAKDQRQETRQESKTEYSSQDSQKAPAEEEWFVDRSKEALARLDASMLLAPSLSSYVTEACQASGFPIEFIMPCVLAAVSACVGATAKVRIASTWLDSAALWVGIVGRPGTGKTPSLGMGLETVRNLQATWYRQWKEEMDGYQEELAEWEMADRKIRGQKPQPPRARRILTGDTTIEALVPVLEHSPRGLLLERDELAGWIKSFNQYKKKGGADREHWLSIWSSTPILVDRKADNFFAYIRDPFVAVVGGIQPGKIRGLIGGEDDGFSDRLLLFYPEAVPHGISDVILSHETRVAFDNLLTALTELAFDQDSEGSSVPFMFQLDAQARVEFSQRLDTMVGLASDPNVPESLANAYTKAGSHAARVALVLHLAQCVDNAGVDQMHINVRTIKAAWAIVEVAMSHLRRIYVELAVTPQDALVEKVVGWIDRAGGTVTVRDLMLGRCPGCATSSGTKALLYQLEDRRLGKLSTEKPPHGNERLRFVLAGRS